MKNFLRMMLSDLRRIVPLIVIGWIIIRFSPAFAVWSKEPAYSAWGLFIGGSFYAGAMTYTLRRMILPKIEVTPLVREAVKTPTGAGLVFLGICFIMGMTLMLFGSAIKA